jgi:hypothetical protein
VQIAEWRVIGHPLFTYQVCSAISTHHHNCVKLYFCVKKLVGGTTDHLIDNELFDDKIHRELASMLNPINLTAIKSNILM